MSSRRPRLDPPYPRMLAMLMLPKRFKARTYKPASKTNTIVFVVALAQQRFEIACVSHRGESCRHVDVVLSAMRPWYRQRTHVAPLSPEAAA